MDSASPPFALGSASSPRTSTHPEESSTKRRKIRKGTTSCWDCKRRKIRCIFASPQDSICVNCQRRGAPCVGQDLPEGPATSRVSHQNIDSKIVRVESLLNDLATKLGKDMPVAEKLRESNTTRDSTPVNVRSQSTTTSTPQREPSRVEETYIATGTPTLRASRHNHASISEALIAALPCREDLEMVVREGQGPADYAHMLNNEQQGLLTRETYKRKGIVANEMPSSRAHPVLLARQMMFWSIFLQLPKLDQVHAFAEPPKVLRQRMVTAVVDLVNTNDDLHGSLESLECMMLEGMYHTYLGNLRRAWLVYRRAMLLAELMGVHRYPAQALKSLDPEIVFHPLSMWYRIVHMDRYLCLLLGLPPGTMDDSMGVVALTQRDTCDIRRYERLLSSIAGKVLARNHHGTLSYAQDRLIDTELLQASRSMPEEFWHIPRFEGVTPGSFEDARTVEPFVAQVFHFQLLNQLHWPYMLRSIHTLNQQGASRHEDYSTIVCANASREILSRFVAYRSFNNLALCFRPVDLATLTGALALVLAHLDIHLSRSEDPPTMSRTILAHQRLSDRTLLHQVIEKLRVVSEYNVSLEGAKLLESLLKVESEAAQGEQEYHWTGQHESDIALRIPIPYFGSICISRRGRISKAGPDTSSFGMPASMISHTYQHHQNVHNHGITTPASDHNIHSNSNKRTLDMLTPDTQDGISSSTLDARTLADLTPGTTMDGAFGVDMMNDDCPAISAGMDEWAFQGVDMAFFDSLIMNVPGATMGQDGEHGFHA